MAREIQNRSQRPLVFVIEDDATIARAVAELLDDAGYATRVAPTYEAASSYLAAIVPDCVVLDCALPDGSGDDVLRDLVHRRDAPPTVLLSGHTSAKDLAGRFGVALVSKPYDAEVLLAAVDTSMEHSIRPRYARSA